MKNAFIDNLVREWSWRVNDGLPDPKNRSHIMVLEAVLRQYKYSDSFIEAYISQLTEETTFQARSKESGKIVDFKSKEAMEKAVKAGSHDEIDKKELDAAREKEEKAAKYKKLYGTDAVKIVKQNQAKQSSDDTTEKPTVKSGTLSDAEDPLSDGGIKLKSLEYGHNNITDKDGNTVFEPAPGNASSMYNEIMSGESYAYLEKNPNMTAEELAEKLYGQTKDTTLGKQIGEKGLLKRKKDGSIDKKSKALITAKAGIKKFKDTQKAVDMLESDGKMKRPVKSRNYYGHKESLSKQIAFVNDTSGPFYTEKGVEVSKEELIDLIKNSGGGDNPSDTSTLTVDKNGAVLVEFHSDKQDTGDIQGSSTPTKEVRQALERLEKTNLSENEKAEASKKIEESGKKLAEIEGRLKTVAIKPSVDLQKKEPKDIIESIKGTKGLTGSRDATQYFRGKKSAVDGKGNGIPKNNLKPYLQGVQPAGEDGKYTDEQFATAFLQMQGETLDERFDSHIKYLELEQERIDKIPDGKDKKKEQKKLDNRKSNLTKLKEIYDRDGQLPLEANKDKGIPNPSLIQNTGAQDKLINRLAKANGIDIDKDISNIREETVKEIQNNLLELNKQSINLGKDASGKEIIKPLGDYLESKNIRETLHIGGPAAKHDGLIKVNMGGIVVTQDVINDCLEIDPNDPLDFERDFVVGIVGDDEQPENKYQYAQGFKPGKDPDYPDGLISGRRVMVYFTTKSGKKVPFAQKTQRAGDGPSSKLRSTYLWSEESQDCFKNHPSNKEEGK